MSRILGLNDKMTPCERCPNQTHFQFYVGAVPRDQRLNIEVTGHFWTSSSCLAEAVFLTELYLTCQEEHSANIDGDPAIGAKITSASLSITKIFVVPILMLFLPGFGPWGLWTTIIDG